MSAFPLAHVAHESGGFASGFLHPVTGFDHVLAMVAVGLWGAQLGKPAVWWLPIAFPLMMACGAALGVVGAGLPGVEIGIAASAVVLGLAVLLELRPPLGVAIVVVGVFAVFHGHAHGTELPAGQSGLLYSVGFVVATGLLHAVGIGIGSVHRWKSGAVAIRAAGALVLAGGLFYLAEATGLLA